MLRRLTVALVVLAFALTASLQIAGAQGPGDRPPGGGMGRPGMGGPGGNSMGGPGGMMMPMPVDSFAAERDSMIKVELEDLGPKADSLEENVFHNLKVMKGRTAKDLLNGMNGMSRALGVSCRHCHIPGHWKDDDKKPKEVTRGMLKMTMAINDDHMAKIDFGGEDHPHVGCFTCHRGEKEPGHMMRMMMRQQQGGRPGMGGPGGPGGNPQH